MDMNTIIVFIGALLVLSVVGSIVFTKKEQAAALKRQQIASYRMRADEAQDLYDGLQNVGLEKITYQFLLERIILNLQAAYEIDPTASGIKHRLNTAKSIMNNFEAEKFQINMPSGIMELQGIVGRLNKLMRYLVTLYQSRSITDSHYQNIMPTLQRTLLRFDAEGQIRMGHQAANDGQQGSAKQFYSAAKERILEYGTEEQYAANMLEKVEEFLQGLEDKADKPITYNSSDVDQTTDGSTVDPQLESSDSLSQEELNRQNDEDAEFTPKKKW